MAWYLLSVSLHILAACVWIGGMVFLAAVIFPVLRQPAYRAVALPLVYAVALRLRWLGWAALATLVVTGIVNLAYHGYGMSRLRDGSLWDGWFGRVLATKLALVLAILVITAAHDLLVTPHLVRVRRLDPDDGEVRRARRQAAWVGRVVLLLSLAAVVLGVMLVRGVPQ